MALQEEVDRINEYISQQKPEEMFLNINPMKSGIMAIMNFLSIHNGPVSPGQLSESLNVSSARTAALLRKMEQQDLITRTTNPKDRRKVCVCLSEHGNEVIAIRNKNITYVLGELIDRMGMEKLDTLFALTDEMKMQLNEIMGPVKEEMDRELRLDGDENQ